MFRHTLAEKPRGRVLHQHSAAPSASENRPEAQGGQQPSQAEGSCWPQKQQAFPFILRGSGTRAELLLLQTYEQQRLHGQLERRTNPSARWADEKSNYSQETDPFSIPSG